MNTRTVAFAAIAIALLIGCAGLGYAYYSGSTDVEDNTVDTRYSILYITDSQGSAKYPVSSLLSNVPSSVTEEQISQSYTFDAASDGSNYRYLAYRDTEDLTATSAPEEPGVVHGDRAIIALQVTLSGMPSLNGSSVTLKIGGSTATSVISNGGCTIIGNSFSTVNVIGMQEKSSFIGRISLLITPYSAGTIDMSSAQIEMTAYHTELTATGKLSVSSMSTTGSSGQYSTKSNISYTNSPATGSDLAVLEMGATYDSTWYDSVSNEGGIVTAVLYDSVRGTSVSQSFMVGPDYKWQLHLPVKLSGGSFYGSLEIYSVGIDENSNSPHSLSTGSPASITLTMKETIQEVL